MTGKNLVKEKAKELGFHLFGVADISVIKKEFRLSPHILAGVERALSLGFRLQQQVLEEIEDRPTPLYFHHYRQINNFLDQNALKLASWLQEEGYKAIPIPASQLIDWQNQRGHVSHKKIAEFAGLGWLGRNNLLVTPQYGARVRLVTILTNMPLEADGFLKAGCGDCMACLAVCPAQAIKEKSADFDHQICFAKLKEFQKKGYVPQYICGICVKACKGKK